MSATLLQLLLDFSLLSLITFGGMISGLPEIQRRVVDVHGWMDARTFADLYAIGYAMPGPNVLVATLVGYKVAGVAGAFVATVAIALPSTLIAIGLASVWHRFREARWRRAAQIGLLPVTVGLVSAGSYIITREAAHDVLTIALLLGTIAVALFTRVHPLWMVVIGALLGVTGVV
jgi:chromate transporter